MTVFEASGLTKTYREKRLALRRDRMTFTALDNVDLRLEHGRIYGLVGNNGAGKTTLMRIIAGLSLPSAGRIALFGAETERELSAARQRLGLLLSPPNGYDDLSLWQNLLCQAKLLPHVQKRELEALWELVGLRPELRSRTLRKASTGERQRYGLVSALMGDPELLLLDEPMNGLDPGGMEELRELLLRLNRERGLTMLISSHLLAELHKAATDYIFLYRGRIVETLSAGELDARMEARKLRNPEDYFLALMRQVREGGV